MDLELESQYSFLYLLDLGLETVEIVPVYLEDLELETVEIVPVHIPGGSRVRDS